MFIDSSSGLTLLFFIPIALGCFLITLFFVGDSIKEYFRRVQNFKHLKHRITDWSQYPNSKATYSKQEDVSELDYIEQETNLIGKNHPHNLKQILPNEPE